LELKLTTELTSEQIVTNILVSNEILKPRKKSNIKPDSHSLGEYISKAEEENKINKKYSRYSFIDTESGWNF